MREIYCDNCGDETRKRYFLCQDAAKLYYYYCSRACMCFDIYESEQELDFRFERELEIITTEGERT